MQVRFILHHVKINWERLVCVVPGLAGALNCYGMVEALVAGALRDGCLLAAACGVCVAAFSVVWFYTGVGREK